MSHNFITAKAKQDPIIENVFSKHDSEIVKTAFKHRGFISGGCAILLKRYDDLALDSEKESIDDYHRWKSVFNTNYWITQDYVNSPELSLRLSHSINNIGDIDIWFPTKQDYDLFISDIKEIELQSNKKMFMFESKYATNIMIVEIEELDNKDSIKIFTQCKIQAINKDFGSKEVIMNNFDLLNSMIAFDGELFTYVDSWKDIDDRREIIVDKFNSETLKRILKYSAKKDFNKLSEGASKLIKDELLNTIHWIDQIGVNVTKKSDIDLSKLSVFQLQTLWKVVKDSYDDIICDAGNSFGVHAIKLIKEEKPQSEQKAKVVNELLENAKNIIKKLSTSDILELSAYQCDQLSEDSEDTSTRGYNFMRHALIKKLQERIQDTD